MTELERAEKLRRERVAKTRESPARERAHHLQTLQQTRGNAAVGRHLQRKPAREQAPLSKHHAFEFRIGNDVPAALARAAKEAAGDAPLAHAQLRRLQRVARDNGGVSDTQRMFLAGLLDADNVRMLSRTPMRPGTTIGFSLPRSAPGCRASSG